MRDTDTQAVPLAHRRVPGAGGARLHGGHDPAAVRHAAAVAVQQRRRRAASSSASTISARCSATRAGRPASGTRSGTTPGSSSSTCWCRTRSACCWRRCCPARGCASRAFYRTAIFIPTILSFVIVGFVWKLILSPLWGVAPDHARPGRPEEPVRAVARQGGICADHARPDLGLAVRRHPDDADLCRAAVDPRRGDRGRRMRRHHRHGAVLEDQAAADPARRSASSRS